MFGRFTAVVIGSTTPLLNLGMPVIAQQPFQLRSATLQPGAVIPASVADAAGTQYYYPDTVYEATLRVEQSVYNAAGQIVIPVGSEIRGTIQPVPGGSQFVSRSIVIQGNPYPLQATSGVINDVKDPRQYSGDAIAEDSAIGAAAGVILGAVTGGVTAGGVIGGAAAGAGIGNVTAPRVVVLRPNSSVQLTLLNPLVI
ncbi:MAG: hypothetical protein HC921_01950 [Synechococcaceae cyanobacterium SM2_3_1]|nr:hypothetical protein [Synechococcaceae cyanobacterium SM2_3_1]